MPDPWRLLGKGKAWKRGLSALPCPSGLPSPFLEPGSREVGMVCWPGIARLAFQFPLWGLAFGLLREEQPDFLQPQPVEGSLWPAVNHDSVREGTFNSAVICGRCYCPVRARAQGWGNGRPIPPRSPPLIFSLQTTKWEALGSTSTLPCLLSR